MGYCMTDVTSEEVHVVTKHFDDPLARDIFYKSDADCYLAEVTS